MYRKVLILLIVFCSGNFIASQQIRPLPRAVINIPCGRASILRTTGLTPPPAHQQFPQTCTYTIHAMNFLVCQVRLDFVKFSLPQPKVDSASVTEVYPACIDGYLEVNGIKLCGENSGQHVYIPINPKNINERQLKINIVTNGNGNGPRDWQITVNQLECPFGQSRSLDMKTNTTMMENFEKPIRTPKALVSDWLAPPGCLQYFVEPQGMIDSFNYNNAQGPYIGNMNYAICFRRQRNDRAVELTRTTFQMAVDDPTNWLGIDEQCIDRAGNTVGRSSDFLFIPHAIVDLPPKEILTNPPAPIGSSPTRATRFCGNSLEKATSPVVSSSPGPFQITFNSDKNYSPTLERGFRLAYRIV